MTKIVIISKDFPDILGGISHYTAKIAKALADKSTKVFVLTSCDERIKPLEDIEVAQVVKKWGLGSISYLFREIKRIRPDFVILQYEPYMYARKGTPFYLVLFALLLWICGSRLITRFHEVAIRFDATQPKHLFLAFFQRLVAFLLAAFSYKIVFSAMFDKRMLFYPNKSSVIPVGSNFTHYEVKESDKKKLREKLCGTDDIMISAFASGGYERKKEFIIESIGFYIKTVKKPPVKLIFIGQLNELLLNRHKKVAQSLVIEDRVFFTRFLDEKEAFLYFACSDIYLHFYSLKTGGGGVSGKSGPLAAALAAGLPIISNKGDLTDKIFENGKNILFVDHLSHKNVIDLMVTVSKNASLREKLKKGAKALYDREFSWDQIAGRYKNIMGI